LARVSQTESTHEAGYVMPAPRLLTR